MGDDVYDITILGAGPTGLYAAFYAGLRGLRTKLIDALPQVGGQLAALYPEKDIFDVAGFRRVAAKRLVAELAEQGLAYEPTLCLGERAERLTLPGDPTDLSKPLRLGTTAGEHLTRVVLIAAGVGAFAPRKLESPGVAEFEGRGIYYYVRRLDELRGRRVLVVGGGDSAVDWALALHERGSPVTLIHRRDEFRAHEDSVRRLRESNIEVRTFWELAAAFGGERLEGVELVGTKTGERERIAVDAVVLSLGFKADLGPLAEWGMTIDRGGIVVDPFMRTSLPRVYAAGDIAQHPAKLKLIATGFAEAAIAVNFAKAQLDPKARAFPGHSSDLAGT